MQARTRTTAASAQPTAAKARNTAAALFTTNNQAANAMPAAMQAKMPTVTIVLAFTGEAPCRCGIGRSAYEAAGTGSGLRSGSNGRSGCIRNESAAPTNSNAIEPAKGS